MSDLNKEVVREQLRKIGSTLQEHAPPGWGFALLMFEFSDEPGGNMQWVSNGRRPEMIKTIREFSDRLVSAYGGQPGVDDPGSHV